MAAEPHEAFEQVTSAWLRTPAPGEWAEDAACKGLTDIFTADELDDDTLASAKRICASCPVLTECAAYSDGKHLHGLWAGVWWHSGRRAAPVAA